ncbi:MAG TPA: hypothetical protein V6C88_20530 [Chroococcidiopsis sp.]
MTYSGNALADDVISEELQATLNRIAAKAADRKDELVDMLCDEQPHKSRIVDEAYLACTWWEGCYYCMDEKQQWHRVKCFA